MAINTDFYGLPETWVEIGSNTGCFKTGYNYGGNVNYTGSLKAIQDSSVTNPDNVASPPLDPSIIPWKINTASDVFNRKYIYPYSDNYTSQQVSTWSYESSQATTVHNGGFRFFLQQAPYLNGSLNYGGVGVWTNRYSPLNTKNELVENVYRSIFPIVDFDYSKMYVRCYLLYVSKTTIDDSSQYWSSNTTNSVSLSQLLDENAEIWLSNNYVYGLNIELRYQGITASYNSPIGMFAFDELHPTSYAGGYYPYARNYHHYQNNITLMNDVGQMGRATIGGVVGGNGSNWTNRWDSVNHTDIVELYLHNYKETSIQKIQGGIEKSGLLNSKTVSSSSSAQLRLFPRVFNSLGVSGILEYARKEMAYLGFRFSEYGNPTEEQLYLPEINSLGVTTGNYKPLSEAEDYDNYNWTNDVYERTPYDYQNDVGNDPNTYDNNITVLNTTINTISQEFVTPYVLNDTILKNVATFLYDTINTDWNPNDYNWSGKALYVNNPMDVVISLMYFPFDVLTAPYVRTFTDDLLFGSLNSEIASPVLYSSYCILDFGKCTYYPNYGVKDFRNYEPYCKGELYIPYCGSVSINPAVFLDKTLSVKMIVDLRTGSCLALVYRDSMVMQTIRGQMGITIPISGIQAQTLASSEVVSKTIAQNADISETMNFIDMAGTFIEGATGNKSMLDIAGSYATSILSSEISTNIAEKAAFNVNHVNVPFKVIGTASPVTSLANERRCRFILKRPVMLTNDLSNFAHQNGFATLEHDTLNNYRGYTVCDTADLSGINCTKTEKNLIMNFLKNGVYL